METTQSNPGPGTAVMRIVVVDDHPWVRMGLLALLATEEDFAVCGEAEDAPSAIELVAKANPDMAIIDISIKGDIDGIELTRQLKAVHPNLLVLTLSLHAESEYETRALAAGASAYLCKSAVSDSLFDTLRSIANKASPPDPAVK
jgi:DNA-binding NarL/FixJ family response regulator